VCFYTHTQSKGGAGLRVVALHFDRQLSERAVFHHIVSITYKRFAGEWWLYSLSIASCRHRASHSASRLGGVIPGHHMRVWEGCHESRRCSRDTYPESYISPSILVYEDYTHTQSKGGARLRVVILHFDRQLSERGVFHHLDSITYTRFAGEWWLYSIETASCRHRASHSGPRERGLSSRWQHHIQTLMEQ